MSQKLLVNKFEWLQDTSQFSEDVMKNYNEEIDEGYFLEVHVQYPEKLHELHSGLPFLPELMKVEIVEKLVANLQTDKTENVMHIRNLKQALNHGLVLKKSHRIFIFKQKAWLKSYIDMNIDLRRNAKIFEKDLKKKKLWKTLEKDFLKMMKNAAFWKTMEKVRKHGDKKLVTKERRRSNYLVAEPKYHNTKFFT